MSINLDKLIDITKFNNIQKLLRVTAYVLRFASRDRKGEELSNCEIENARKLWLINEQKSDALEREQ